MRASHFILFKICCQQNGGTAQVIRPPSYQSGGEPAVKYTAVGQHDVDGRVSPPAYTSEHVDGK